MADNPVTTTGNDYGGTPPKSSGTQRIPIDNLDLGDRVLVYYSDGTSEVLAKGRLGSAGGGGESLSPNTVYSNQQQNARDAASLAEQQRQFNEQFGYNKARGDQQQQVSQGDLTGYYNGSPTLARDRLGLDQQNAAFDYYKYLSNLAANPRNFVESFFARRGAPVPQGAEQYGTGLRPGDVPPFAQYMGGARPSFVNTTARDVSRPQTYPGAVTAGAPMTWGSSGNGFGTQYQGTQIAPNIAQVTQPNGQPLQVGGRGYTDQNGVAGVNVTDTGNEMGNLTGEAVTAAQAANPLGSYVVNGKRTNIYAHGGIVPEPVMGVGMRSGQRYMFGENGPEGIVPADMLPKFLQSRHGQTVGNQRNYLVGGAIGFDPGVSDPYYSDPYAGQATADPYSPPSTYSGPNDPSNPYSGAYNPYDVNTTQSYGPQVPTGYGPVQQAPADQSTVDAMIAAAIGNLGNTFAQQSTPVQNGPAPHDNTLDYAPQQPMIPNYVPPSTPIGTSGTTTTLPYDGGFNYAQQVADFGSPTPLGPSAPVPGQTAPGMPLGLPQPSNAFNASVATPTPAVGQSPLSASPAGTFGAPIGNRPQFLAGEDNGGTIGALQAAGILPPFFSRLLAQARGDRSQGTNTPQRFDLPANLPIVSSLAARQMAPTERAALESIISSYGIDPQDYWAYVDSLAPQGGQAQSPLFGNAFLYGRQ